VGMGWRLGAAREWWRGAGGEARATACGGGSPGKPQNRVPGLGFEHGLDGEVEHDEGNPIRVIRRGPVGRNGGTTAGGGSGSTARPCGAGEAGERERNAPMGVLTTMGSSWSARASVRGSETAARRRTETRNKGGGARALGFVEGGCGLGDEG
jgi:hypothetical protein